MRVEMHGPCLRCGHDGRLHDTEPDEFSCCKYTDSEGPCLCEGFKANPEIHYDAPRVRQ